MKQVAVVMMLIVLVSCRGTVNKVSFLKMGTIINLTFIADAESAGKAVEAVSTAIDRVENLMSPYRPGSDIYRLNRDGAAGPVAVSAETYMLIKESADLSAETRGAFDITFAALAPLWDYKNKHFIPPPPAAVAALLPLVDSRNIVFHPENMSVAFARPGMKIGLGAIAKGYAVQKGIEALKKQGITAGIVEAGGDLQVIGKKFFEPWITGLKHPRKDSILLIMELEDMDAAATSGDYERFVMYQGMRYHHIIDPATGYPANGFSSVTVLSKNPVLSDAYATAIFVMGLDRAREFLKRHGEILVILADRDVNLYVSKRLRKRITFLDKRRVEWL